MQREATGIVAAIRYACAGSPDNGQSTRKINAVLSWCGQKVCENHVSSGNYLEVRAERAT